MYYRLETYTIQCMCLPTQFKILLYCIWCCKIDSTSSKLEHFLKGSGCNISFFMSLCFACAMICSWHFRQLYLHCWSESFQRPHLKSSHSCFLSAFANENTVNIWEPSPHIAGCTLHFRYSFMTYQPTAVNQACRKSARSAKKRSRNRDWFESWILTLSNTQSLETGVRNLNSPSHIW